MEKAREKQNDGFCKVKLKERRGAGGKRDGFAFGLPCLCFAVLPS